VKEALLLYESDITESKAQVRTLTSLIGALLNCRNFTSEDYEALITKVAQYANKLLKKPDQCRLVTLCSHLFYRKRAVPVPVPAPVLAAAQGTVEGEGEEPALATAVAAAVEETVEDSGLSQSYSDPDRSLECMQRALKIASVANPNLFVEILDR
jgi:vacuolar protein sorting-associated protein 35